MVIPTWDRETRLAFALEALADQTLERDRFEVIVARAEGSRGPLARAPEGLNVRFLEGAGGPASRRNLAWRQSRAPLVAFTDDDCRPAPEWLAALCEAAAEAPEAILQGRTEPDPEERHLLTGLARSIEVTSPSAWFETCNIAYPRALLESVDGFDEGFDECWGEDTDLGLRSARRGARLVYLDRALAWHAVVGRSLPAAVAQARRREWQAALIARHPELRSELRWRVAANETHLTLPLMLAGLAAVQRRRRVLGAAMCAPYLARATASHLAQAPLSLRSLARLAVHIPPATIVGIAEITATVRGAIRHRTLLI